MKHTFFSLLLLTTFGLLGSAGQDPSTYKFETTLAALFLKPGSSNLHFAVEAITLPAPSPNWNMYDLHPEHNVGFDLGFKLLALNHKDYMSIHWEHFRSGTSSAVSVSTDNMVGPFFEIGPDASTYSDARGKTCFNSNEINLDFGRYQECSDKWQTDLFAGIGITRIEQSLRFTYANKGDTTDRTIITPNSFFGVGPQFGIDMYYALRHNFYITGKGMFTLLSGKVKNHTNYLALSPALSDLGITPPNRQSITVQNRSVVIPAFEEKIGVAFSLLERDCYFIQVEVGYQAQLYVSALQSIDMGSEVVTPPVVPDTVGVYARTFQRNISNFSLTGAYFSIAPGF